MSFDYLNNCNLYHNKWLLTDGNRQHSYNQCKYRLRRFASKRMDNRDTLYIKVKYQNLYQNL